MLVFVIVFLPLLSTLLVVKGVSGLGKLESTPCLCRHIITISGLRCSKQGVSMFEYMYECLARCRSKGGIFLMTVEIVRAQPKAAS